MAKKSSLLIPLLLLGILAIIALNWLIFFPWAYMNHSATSDSIDRHEKLIADIAAELNDIRGVSARLQSGQLSPFDRRVREALKGGSQEVQDYLNSPLFSEEAGKRAPPPPAINDKKVISADSKIETVRPAPPKPAIRKVAFLPPSKEEEPPKQKHPPPSPVIFGDTVDDSTLVVGGTDGSGTRRVVEVLTQLGVTMVSEDPETYDIHADVVGGWPKIVDPVISETHGLMYDPDTVKAKLRDQTNDRISKVLDRAKADSKKPESTVLARGGKLNGPEGVRAAGVSFGIKAPVAMVMVPWWRHMSPNFKFLHVVRDGRDIAFSANQGPVNKFYKTMYPQTSLRQPSTNLKAIHLWSDWNSQIHKWSEIQQPGQVDKSYGYMLLHSEDLVDDRIPVKFAALKNLATWVNSDASNDYICCLAVKGSTFMGSHDRTARDKVKSASQNAAQLKKRYGKWKEKTKKDQKLADTLHKVGAEGLELLGYEPSRSFADESTAWGEEEYQCTLTPFDCGVKVPVPVTSKDCTLQMSTDFRASGMRIDLTMTAASTVEECCGECKANEKCKYFTYAPENSYCYLKSGTGKIITGPTVGALISGTV